MLGLIASVGAIASCNQIFGIEARDVAVDAGEDALADLEAGDAAEIDVAEDVAPDAANDLGAPETDSARDTAGDVGASEADAVADSGVLVDTGADASADATMAPDADAGPKSNCGDGVVDGAEGCDDSGKIAGDGCSSTCTIEAGWACKGAPTVCTRMPTIPKSCAVGGRGIDDCGPFGTESCCASPLVTGIATTTFYRDYDGGYTWGRNADHPARASDFRLDRYEITVGRFRKFVDAVIAGWTPSAGSGKHAHLNGGSGLSTGTGTYETGWNASWNPRLLTDKTSWDGQFAACASGYESWNAGDEHLPINCISWYQAYAFCIWDDGFLPTDVEWNYAAAGGTEQRPYPWGDVAPRTDLAIYGCLFGGGGACTGFRNLAPVGWVWAGKGRFGQSDLAGNLREWNLDVGVAGYVIEPCADCAYLSDTTGYRFVRGGAFDDTDLTQLLNVKRSVFAPASRMRAVGARCARGPLP